MKKNIYKTIGLSFTLVFLMFTSCEDPELIDYNTGGIQEVSDSYLQVETQVVSFQAGIESYDISFNLVNGTKSVSKVNIYSTFTDAGSGLESNEILLSSYDVTDPTIEAINDSFTYDELKSGLTVDGSGLPDSDTDLAVGSGWSMRFEAEFDDFESGSLAGSINVAVLSRFAGIYKPIETAYYRIGVESGLTDWSFDAVGETRFIGSVDENTFSYNDWWGPFGWTGSSFNFDLNEDNTITGPIITDDGLFSGAFAINCTDNPGDLSNVPCDGSNVLIPDDVTGKHRIIITYGYFTEDTDPTIAGAREFYEVLEKVVE